MRIMSFSSTYSAVVLAALFSAGCGTQEADMTDKRVAKPTAPVIRPENGLGGLSLKMPSEKPGKRTQTLVVTLDGSSHCYGYGGDGSVDGDYVEEDGRKGEGKCDSG